MKTATEWANHYFPNRSNAYKQPFIRAFEEIQNDALEQFRAWGSQGGKKSTRKLTSAEAKRMVAIREQKRAQKKVENNACVS